MNKIIISIILGVLLVGGIVLAERFENNLLRYGEIDTGGNFIMTTNPITNVNIIGFVCSSPGCSSVSGTLWGGSVLNAAGDSIQLTYPTTLLSPNGYGIYFYKEGYIPYEVNADWWGTSSSDPVLVTDYLSKKQNCIAHINNINIAHLGGNINVNYDVPSPITHTGPLNYVPASIDSQYKVRVNTTLDIYFNNSIFYTESKILNIPYSQSEPVSFSVPAPTGVYTINLQTSIDDAKCLNYTPIYKEQNITQCVPTSEICGNGIDDDCDGFFDCVDSDCSGNPACFIICDSDDDCGILMCSELENVCGLGIDSKKIFHTYTTPRCENPGTTLSYCTNSSVTNLIGECVYNCASGKCTI